LISVPEPTGPPERRRTSWLSQVVEAGPPSLPDPADVRLRRTLLAILALSSGVAAVAWSALYAAFGEWAPALLPAVYALGAVATLLAVGRRYSLALVLRMQLVLILFTPFLLGITLGGFVESSGVVLWSLLAPIGAFLIGGRKGALPWLGAYVVLVAATALLEPWTRSSNNLPEWIVQAFFVLNIGGVSAIAFGMLYHFVGENQRILRLLGLEKEKSERLLLNVLPQDIVDSLRDDQRTIADRYEAVSILFADIVGFTSLSREMAPEELVDLLNHVFTRFDFLAAKHGVEKLKTVGDTYMAVSGAPQRRSDHAHALARMAIEMRQWLAEDPRLLSVGMRFRIGINSGAVVAGVIGTTKFQYDIWGDAVNLASRMESHGEPGRIQVGPVTRELLKEEFVLSPRGEIDVKGQGTVQAWFLEVSAS
jgi:guanylate cyclase